MGGCRARRQAGEEQGEGRGIPPVTGHLGRSVHILNESEAMTRAGMPGAPKPSPTVNTSAVNSL